MFELIVAILEVLADFFGCYSGDSNNSGYDCNFSSGSDNYYEQVKSVFDDDEDLYANTDAWRSLHPYDYNPYTGGSNQSEDKANGW